MNLLPILFLSLYFYNAYSADPAGSLCNQATRASLPIDDLLPKLVEGTIQNGFIQASSGQGKNQIYGLAQCRGDVSKSDCASCIQDAATQIRKLCPNRIGAKVWYDYCFLRYEIYKFFDQVDTSGVILYNVQNVTDPEVFNKKLSALMDQVRSDAVKPINKGLGKGKSDVSTYIRLYGLVQCTRDLSELNCAQCAAIAISSYFPTVCNNRRGCRVLFGSCYVRYELYPFFFPLEAGETMKPSSHKYESIRVYRP